MTGWGTVLVVPPCMKGRRRLGGWPRSPASPIPPSELVGGYLQRQMGIWGFRSPRSPNLGVISWSTGRSCSLFRVCSREVGPLARVGPAG